MAEQCANPDCNRSDLLQPDVANLQCLACGSLTSIATGELVGAQPKQAPLSAMGQPVVELSHDVVEEPANDFDRRERDDSAPVEVTPVVTSIPAEESTTEAVPDVSINESDPEESEVTPEVPAPLDLSGLTPEQIDAIAAIIHPGS